VKRLGGRRALVVTDAGVHAAGVLAPAIDSLELNDVTAEVYAHTPSDPSFSDVDRIAERILEFAADTVVSAGGGSALAAGRTSALTATNGGKTVAIAGSERYREPPLLSICIPTTAGSGGEVSRQATLTDDATGKKSGVQGWHNAARLAILDPTLLVSVPRSQAVASGIDAMTHALEAFVSRRATWLTDALAVPSFRTLFHELPGSIDPSGRDVVVLERLQLAASAANLACGNAGLGLVHGLNKGITYIFHTQHYQSVPYGMLHSILLPWVIEFNIPAALERFARLAELMGVERDGRSDESVAREGVDRMRDWLRRLGGPQRLPWDRCTEQDVRDILDETLGRPMAKDNPRASAGDDLAQIVGKCLEGWQ
jgi:alcohol dehydrogenase class IV